VTVLAIRDTDDQNTLAFFVSLPGGKIGQAQIAKDALMGTAWRPFGQIAVMCWLERATPVERFRNL
jgi:hypothetical protein